MAIGGSHHGDEISLIFDMERELPEDSLFTLLNKTGQTEKEKPVTQIFTKVFTSFARTGQVMYEFEDFKPLFLLVGLRRLIMIRTG
jgi:hypothetical protein